jgi:CBS domain containing-hemolysin-like protein
MGLTKEEITMVVSLIDLKNIKVKDEMILMEKIFKLNIKDTLDETLIS